MKTHLFFLLIIFFFSCETSVKNINSKSQQNILAFIDTIPIVCDSVDILAKQELFDELNRIYLIRKVTLNLFINRKILEFEAVKQKISVNNLIDNLNEREISENNLNRYSLNYFPQHKISELKNSLKFYDVNSKNGKEILLTYYKKYILNRFIDSLKNVHKIRVLLQPPQSPEVLLNDLLINLKGNENSRVTFLVISDFDCSICKENNCIYDKIFNEYNKKIKFGYTYFGSYISNSDIASECAANQKMFWQMHDSIFQFKTIPDSIELFRIANNLGLNMDTFRRDFYNDDIRKRIKDNFTKLENAGIYGTPTIIINNQIIFNSSSIAELKRIIDTEIKEFN
jgi:protein-disulfide isomerase